MGKQYAGGEYRKNTKKENESDKRSYIREEVMLFAEAMEKELRRHDKKKGETWKKMSLYELEEMIRKAVKTIDYEGQNIDVANLCMMHFDNLRRFDEERQPPD